MIKSIQYYSDDRSIMDLVFQNITTDVEHGSKFFEDILSVAIKELAIDHGKLEMSINLIGEEEIKELNSRYRHKDNVTDVLSFPIEQKPLKESDSWPLGDIFICVPFAKTEAKSENISIERKLAQLTVHGFLHLLGYDHEVSGEEAKKMFGLEEKIMNKLDI